MVRSLAHASKLWTAAALPAPNGGYPVAVFTPKDGTPPEGGWPVVVWVHGFSLRGEDLRRLTEYGPPAVLDALPPRFVLLAPQLPGRDLGWVTTRLDATLTAALRGLPAAGGRRYAVGASIGAGAAYDWVAGSDTFHGLLMMAGAGAAGKAKAVAKVPVWLLHGADDRTVPLARARATEEALKAAGGVVRFTELPQVGHDGVALTRAMVGEGVIPWLLEQKRAG